MSETRNDSTDARINLFEHNESNTNNCQIIDENLEDYTSFVDLNNDYSNFNKLCILPNKIKCKQKILQNVERIKEGKIEEFDDYYENIIESGVNFIKLPFAIYNNQNLKEIENSVLGLKEIMKMRNVKIPIMISMETKVMRFDSDINIKFNKEEKVNFTFYSDYKLKNEILSKYKNDKFYFITNYDYMMINKLTPGDKIIIDFGSASFLISKIVYKNGDIKTINDSEMLNFKNISENENDQEDYKLNYEDIEKEEYKINHNQSKFNHSSDVKEFLNKFYENKKFKKIQEFSFNDEIEFIETICLYNCNVNPNRPVLVMKKLKYDKYDYIPNLFFVYVDKLIKEIEFEYLILDLINPQIYEFVNEKVQKYNKKIPILTKISDLYTLNYMNEISENSVGVIISFNNLIKEISFLDIVILTEGLIKLFKKRGLAVYCHAQILESLRKKNKPLTHEINDILYFIKSGIDGFNLGSETFSHDNNNILSMNSILTLREILKNFNKSYSKIENPLINYNLNNNKINKNNTMLRSYINSCALLNSLKKNENLILILISDDEKFLRNFLSKFIYNHIILVTNRTSIMRNLILFSITHCILVKNITHKVIEEKEKIENELINVILEDNYVKFLNSSKKENYMVYCKCIKGEDLEFFSFNK